MNDALPLDYVRKLEAALLEYVEKYGASEAVRNLFRAPEHSAPSQDPVLERNP
jgi:hypothetical protein